MIEVQPEVFLIGKPEVNTQEMLRYLRLVGGEEWFERVGAGLATRRIPQAEGLIEFMGRLCYRSWSPGLNQNVTKIREDRGDYLLNILRSGHGSVLTHAWFNFVIHNGSRVFTAEMNRHAVGTAISEQSLRYVRLDEDIPFRLPREVLKPESIQMMEEAVGYLEGVVGEIYKTEGIESSEDFFSKKTITSAVRRIAPLGMATEEGWSGNVRSIRHVIEMRTDPHAEEEIRIVADQIARKMQRACPLLFGDYEEVEVEGSSAADWQTQHRKV
jgi:thymidylate synthase (FAD)